MEIADTIHLAHPRKRIWIALNDPQVFKQCLSGFARLGDGEFASTLATPLGPVDARVSGRITRLAVDANGMTQLSFHAKIKVDGTQARLSPHMLEDAARQAINHFFLQFAETLSGMADATQRAAEQTAAQISDARLSPLFGIVTVIGAIVVLYELIHAV